uniref:Uncharacterized protein n=1 Tax=Candidatus Kentrum sp. TUN TaxID=2126343 RepID=A0A450ZIE7_9GAMM|nr:MAG: hypothetical protein BECKTUN1418D_GA0071000_101314 [Candidatus Kentron sp. TUN]VFK53572.1 MAG: hypothetical protein BECKTUN1418F_GA0071002_102422 [Candidatus Kentron sp. TUN]VFK55028.1 MAG: hypothetical protein BECKTUN1418E_GA0071001_102422 [Candidatus Kentron sp. TUN]
MGIRSKAHSFMATPKTRLTDMHIDLFISRSALRMSQVLRALY